MERKKLHLQSFYPPGAPMGQHLMKALFYSSSPDYHQEFVNRCIGTHGATNNMAPNVPMERKKLHLQSFYPPDAPMGQNLMKALFYSFSPDYHQEFVNRCIGMHGVTNDMAPIVSTERKSPACNLSTHQMPRWGMTLNRYFF